jgi:hypothetical protein
MRLSNSFLVLALTVLVSLEFRPCDGTRVPNIIDNRTIDYHGNPLMVAFDIFMSALVRIIWLAGEMVIAEGAVFFALCAIFLLLKVLTYLGLYQDY